MQRRLCLLPTCTWLCNQWRSSPFDYKSHDMPIRALKRSIYPLSICSVSGTALIISSMACPHNPLRGGGRWLDSCAALIIITSKNLRARKLYLIIYWKSVATWLQSISTYLIIMPMYYNMSNRPPCGLRSDLNTRNGPTESSSIHRGTGCGWIDGVELGIVGASNEGEDACQLTSHRVYFKWHQPGHNSQRDR